MERSHHDDERYIQDLEAALAAKDAALDEQNKLIAGLRVIGEMRKDQLSTLTQELERVKGEAVKWQRIRTPTHGNCCTCQACGLSHDDCRCDLDEVADELTQLKQAHAALLKDATWAMNVVRLRTSPFYDPVEHERAQAFLRTQEGTHE